jgi:hypothetical protein
MHTILKMGDWQPGWDYAIAVQQWWEIKAWQDN